MSEEASLPSYYASSKPWLFPKRPAPARVGEPQLVTADYNSKQAARGGSLGANMRQFELAPLKNR
jgi:hypothetical protein